MNRRRPWTRQEEDDLRKWVSEGVSLAIIAVRLRRTLMAVQNRISQLRKQQKPESEP
jgi:hypothetical protein